MKDKNGKQGEPIKTGNNDASTSDADMDETSIESGQLQNV